MKKKDIVLLLCAAIYCRIATTASTLSSNDWKRLTIPMKIVIKKKSTVVDSDRSPYCTDELSKAQIFHKMKVQIDEYKSFKYPIQDSIKGELRKTVLKKAVNSAQRSLFLQKKNDKSRADNNDTLTINHTETAMEFNALKRGKTEKIRAGIKVMSVPTVHINVKMNENEKNIRNELKDTTDRLSILNPDISKYSMEAEKSIYGNNTSLGKTVELKDARLYYEVYGQGEPLVLLHGNGGSIREFYKQISALSKKFKVFAVDTRSQGKSKDFTKGNLNYKIFADDLRNLMHHLNLSKIHILGWSDGGNTGLEFALKYPQNLKKLVLIGANACPQGLDETIVEHLKGETIEDDNGRRLLHLMLNEPNINKKSLNMITNPVFIIAGENDMIRKEHTEMLAKEIPDSRLKIYPKATHYLLFEIAEELNKDVIDYLCFP